MTNTNPSKMGLAGKRICVVTAGHLSTCPRMLKAADAFVQAGCKVIVISTSWIKWAIAGDNDVISRRSGNWTWKVVKWDRERAPIRNVWSAIRYRFARLWVKYSGEGNDSLKWLGAAHVRINTELASAAAAVECDLFYGGGGAMAATAQAAAETGVPFALDLEDFHTGQQDDSKDGRLSSVIIEKIERQLLRKAAFVTAGSGLIADAYHAKYGVNPYVVNNTFPLPSKTPEFETTHSSSLRLYWFSQTIGWGRGLEEVIRALGLAGINAELHLRGRPVCGYLEKLRSLAKLAAPKTQIIIHDPAPPDEMVALAGGFDVGLAVEPLENLNREICISNKAFTYLLAGLAVVFTDTPGQRTLAKELGVGAFVYSPGDVDTLAKGLRAWSIDKNLLMEAQHAAWDAAKRRWHWEHPAECGLLLSATAKVFNI